MRTRKFLAISASCLAACGSPSDVGAEPADSSTTTATTDKAVLTMPVARAAHSPVTMTDGRVLLIGGCVRESCEVGPESSTVDVFDARLGRFNRAGTLLAPRVSTTSARIDNNRVFIAGGWVGSTVTDSTEIFDVKAGSSVRSGNLSSARADIALTVLRDGRILLAGGFDGHRALNTIDVFDPKDGSIRRIGTLAVARTGAGAALLPDGKVLIVGGGVNEPSGLRAAASVEIVDPSTGVSKLTGSLANARYKHSVIAMPNGNVLALGGSDERDSRGKLDTIERFDPSTGQFSLVGRMLEKRYKIGNSVVLLTDGRILIAGGAPRAEVYNPATSKTAYIGPTFGGSLNFATASVLPSHRVLVAGGYYEDGIRMNRRAWILH